MAGIPRRAPRGCTRLAGSGARRCALCGNLTQPPAPPAGPGPCPSLPDATAAPLRWGGPDGSDAGGGGAVCPRRPPRVRLGAAERPPEDGKRAAKRGRRAPGRAPGGGGGAGGGSAPPPRLLAGAAAHGGIRAGDRTRAGGANGTRAGGTDDAHERAPRASPAAVNAAAELPVQRARRVARRAAFSAKCAGVPVNDAV